MTRHKHVNRIARTVGHGVGSPGEPGTFYANLEGSRSRWPMRGDHTLRSVGEDPSIVGPPAPADAAKSAFNLAVVKDVAMNTIESVYPWMGLLLGAVSRNPILRVAAPVAGIAIGVAKAMNHTADAVVASAVDPAA